MPYQLSRTSTMGMRNLAMLIAFCSPAATITFRAQPKALDIQVDGEGEGQRAGFAALSALVLLHGMGEESGVWELVKQEMGERSMDIEGAKKFIKGVDKEADDIFGALSDPNQDATKNTKNGFSQLQNMDAWLEDAKSFCSMDGIDTDDDENDVLDKKFEKISKDIAETVDSFQEVLRTVTIGTYCETFMEKAKVAAEDAEQIISKWEKDEFNKGTDETKKEEEKKDFIAMLKSIGDAVSDATPNIWRAGLIDSETGLYNEGQPKMDFLLGDHSVPAEMKTEYKTSIEKTNYFLTGMIETLDKVPNSNKPEVQKCAAKLEEVRKTKLCQRCSPKKEGEKARCGICMPPLDFIEGLKRVKNMLTDKLSDFMEHHKLAKFAFHHVLEKVAEPVEHVMMVKYGALYYIVGKVATVKALEKGMNVIERMHHKSKACGEILDMLQAKDTQALTALVKQEA